MVRKPTRHPYAIIDIIFVSIRNELVEEVTLEETQCSKNRFSRQIESERNNLFKPNFQKNGLGIQKLV